MAEPRKPSKQPSTARAAGGATAVTVPALAAPAALGLTGVAVTAAEAAKVTAGLVKALDTFGESRWQEDALFLFSAIQKRHPETPLTRVQQLVDREHEYEQEFRRKMRDRLATDLPKALVISDAAARNEAVGKILARERRYTVARQEAMLTRSIAALEHDQLRELSPRGAYWKLSPNVKEHTLDCLAMGNKFWPWKVLDRINPPMHHGCPCELWGLDEAIAAGFMTADQVPDEKDAVRHANRLLTQIGELRDAMEGDEDEIAEVARLLGPSPEELLEEAKEKHTGAMVALYPSPELAKKLAVEGGEPASELHVTLVFLGKAAALPEDKLKAVVAGVAASSPALTGEVSGIGLFTAGPKPVTYCSVDVPGLEIVREHLALALRKAGVEPACDHGYTPHMTLQYDDLNVPFMASEVQNPKLRFDRMTLKLGEKRIDFDLAGKSLEEALMSTIANSKPLAAAGAVLTALAMDGDTSPRHIERAVDGRLDRPAIERPMSQLRWGKGFVKGGEFMPQRGGVSLRVRKSLSPHGPPLSPVAARQRGDARWTWVRGQYRRIPEQEAWSERHGGIAYSSPAGSTNVYRNGRLISEPGQPSLMSERAPQSPGATSEAGQETLFKVNEMRSQRREATLERLSGNGRRSPVREGDGPEVLLSLPHAGFRVRRAQPQAGGALIEYERGGESLTVGWNGKRVTKVEWRPQPAPGTLRVALDRAPQDWEEFRSDVLAWADETGRRFGAESRVPDVIVDDGLDDHAGVFQWSGIAHVGRETDTDIERAALARAEGRALTDDEAHGVYASYWVAAHEAVGHGVNPIDPFSFTGAAKNLEEALAEEASHLLALERLTEQGQTDVVEWRLAHPESLAATGRYRGFRHALSLLFDQAGFESQEQRRKFLLELKFQTPPNERFERIADVIVAKHGGDRQAVLDQAEAFLREAPPPEADGYTAGRPVLVLGESPGFAAVGKLSYGKFDGGELSDGGKLLRMEDGSARRVEKLPLLFDGISDLTDGSAVSAYPPGVAFTDTATYPDGSPKNFRYVDTQDRAKLILRAFTGKGSPGELGVELSPERLRRAVEEIKAAKGWVYIDGVPVKRRFDGSYGVGWGDGDGRNLSGVAGEDAAARVALVRSVTDPPWGKVKPGVDAGPPRSPGALATYYHKLEDVNDAAMMLRAASAPASRERAARELRIATASAKGVQAVLEPGARAAYMSHLYAAELGSLPPEPALAPGVSPPVSDPFGGFMGVPNSPRSPGTVAPPNSPGEWIKKMEDLFHQPSEQKPSAKPKKKPKPKPEFIGGSKKVVPHGPIPAYDRVRLELGKSAGGSNGARWAFDQKGRRWLLKTYRGDQNRIATELLANQVYRELGAKVAEAGTITVKGKPALTYPTLDGEVRNRVFKSGEPSPEVGEHFMADALLANWDFVGADDDNIMWDADGHPFRVDQGGTFEYRAMGQKKPFGPVPTEVWTMLRKGQAKRASAVTEDQMRAQGAAIEKDLTPERIDALVDAAPFKDDAMRERIRENLNARVSWMGAFGRGEIELPKPLEGDDARDELAKKDKGFQVFPEESAALASYLGADQPGDEKEQARERKRLGELFGALKPTREDVIAFAGFDPGGGAKKVGRDTGKDMVGKSFDWVDADGAPFLGATLDVQVAAAHPVVVRLTIPEGTRLLYTPALEDDALPAEPEVLLRKARLRITGRRVEGGTIFLDAAVSQAASKPKGKSPAKGGQTPGQEFLTYAQWKAAGFPKGTGWDDKEGE